MLKDVVFDKVYLACGNTDMRKSIDGLSINQKQDHKEVKARIIL